MKTDVVESVDKKLKTWEKSIKEDSITKKILVEEIENGFLVVISKYGEVKTKTGNTWINEERKYYSATNPLDVKIDATQMAKDTAKALGVNSIFE